MRVITGIYGGRTIVAPHGHTTHPMSERMRGALFASLGELSGLSVLDSYAGSGALSIEALSRGARHVYSVDNDARAVQAMRTNKSNLSIGDSWNIIQQSVYGWTDEHDERFDIVLCDPPYDDVRENHLHRLANVCENLLVLSLPKIAARPEFDAFRVIRDKTYAEGSLVFYKKI